MYTLLVSVMISLGYSSSGDQVIRLDNYYVPGFVTLVACQEYGKGLQRSFRCVKDSHD